MKNQTLLIVDDEPINLVLLESLLEDHYQVLSADSGEAALALCQQEGARIDVVLTDVLMPGMDGYALCRALKANPATATLPVLLITSLEGEEAEVACFACGAADLVHKPYSAELLLARVGHQARLRAMARVLAAHHLLDQALG